MPLMVLAGGLLAPQSEVNGRLAAQLGTGPRTGIAAGAISIGVSLLALLAVSLLMPARRREVAGIAAVFREKRLRPWEASGAVLGACFVASRGLTAPMIGVALFSIAVTAGQACGALFVDHIGLSPSGRQAVSRSRVIATALAVTTMGIGASEQLTAGVAWATVLAAAIPPATGAGLSVQQALNGRIARVVGPWAATVNNMVVGLATPIVAFAVSLLAAGSLNGMPGDADLPSAGCSAPPSSLWPPGWPASTAFSSWDSLSSQDRSSPPERSRRHSRTVTPRR
ncbi:transporter family-2 protein [Streptomyces achromogenes]|uniref:Transporter family-2 protein n=1 Tax=Streptomyces achromogenes TaxID=67255 RepID=A0ABU0QDL1_STRAH|nr:DMT family transporter [Streptomyces achromogenes]MDQ0688739.1 transporter family-2 protein [Streptomyces achromogenes]